MAGIAAPVPRQASSAADPAIEPTAPVITAIRSGVWSDGTGGIAPRSGRFALPVGHQSQHAHRPDAVGQGMVELDDERRLAALHAFDQR